MKFHPFNIKYVEKGMNDNDIVFHDDISHDKFILRMVENFELKECYKDDVKNIENIYALMHTSIPQYIQDVKDFLLHGDIYFIKELQSFVIFSFLKYLGSSSIKNHGFFILEEQVIGKEIQLMFKTKKFINLHEFFEEKNQNDYSFEYVGNLFIHNVESIISKSFDFKELFKVDFLKERADSKNNNFLHNSNFMLLERMDYHIDYNIELFDYSPKQINSDIVKMNDRNNWELNIEKMTSLYNYREGLRCDASVEFTTGFFYECKISPTNLNVIKHKVSKELPYLDESSVIYYMKFFMFYTHKGMLIQSINGLDSISFYFDDIPIAFDIWESFNILSNKKDSSFKKELLKIV